MHDSENIWAVTRSDTHSVVWQILSPAACAASTVALLPQLKQVHRLGRQILNFSKIDRFLDP